VASDVGKGTIQVFFFRQLEAGSLTYKALKDFVRSAANTSSKRVLDAMANYGGSTVDVVRWIDGVRIGLDEVEKQHRRPVDILHELREESTVGMAAPDRRGAVRIRLVSP
jgi:hypothetical protein